MDNNRCPEKAKMYGSKGKRSQGCLEERWGGL